MDRFLVDTWCIRLPKSFLNDEEIRALRIWFEVSLRCDLRADVLGKACAVALHFAEHFQYRRLGGLLGQILVPSDRYRGAGCAHCQQAEKPPCYKCYWGPSAVQHCDACHASLAVAEPVEFVGEYALTMWATNFIRDTMERFQKHRGLSRTDRIYELVDVAAYISGLFDMVVIILQDNRRQTNVDGAIPFVLWIVHPPILVHADHAWDFVLADVLRPIERTDKGDFPFVLACPHNAFLERLSEWTSSGRAGRWNRVQTRDFQFRSYCAADDGHVRVVEPDDLI